MGIFSVLLSGGKPTAEVLWAAGGTTVSKLLSREREGENREGKPELRSVCVLLRSTGRQESDSRRAGHARSTYANMTMTRPNVTLHLTIRATLGLILQKSGRLVWTVMQHVKGRMNVRME